MMNNMELRFSATLMNESLARTAVVLFVSSLNPTLETINEIKTIVSEAVSNAIIHGYHLDSSKDVYLRAKLNDRKLELTIEDYGVGIPNVEEAKVPHYTTRPDLERAGMGLIIIESLADHFEIRSVVGMGTKLSITKSLTTVIQYESVQG